MVQQKQHRHGGLVYYILHRLVIEGETRPRMRAWCKIVSIRQHTPAHVSTRQLTPAYVRKLDRECERVVKLDAALLGVLVVVSAV